jgi:hypothetical protein
MRLLAGTATQMGWQILGTIVLAREAQAPVCRGGVAKALFAMIEEY